MQRAAVGTLGQLGQWRTLMRMSIYQGRQIRPDIVQNASKIIQRDDPVNLEHFREGLRKRNSGVTAMHQVCNLDHSLQRRCRLCEQQKQSQIHRLHLGRNGGTGNIALLVGGLYQSGYILAVPNARENRLRDAFICVCECLVEVEKVAVRLCKLVESLLCRLPLSLAFLDGEDANSVPANACVAWLLPIALRTGELATWQVKMPHHARIHTFAFRRRQAWHASPTWMRLLIIVKKCRGV